MTKTTKALKDTGPVLGTRALNRATLDRQLLLRRSRDLSVKDAVAHLVGLQAQNVKPPYYALAARLEDFEPAGLSALLEARELVRMVTMRSTIHLHTADDARTLRPFVQDALERELSVFRDGLVGVDLRELAGIAREAVEAEPRTMRQLREVLLVRWPGADPQSLAIAARCVLPLVQVTPRGLWRRSGQVALTTVEQWLGRGDSAGSLSEPPSAPPSARAGVRTLTPTPGVRGDAAESPSELASERAGVRTLTPASDARGDAAEPPSESPSEPPPLPVSARTAVPTQTPTLTPTLTPTPAPTPTPTPTPAPDAAVLRYLAAFGPASVKDMQTWSRLTRMREVFERLRPRLRTFRDESGVELFDLPDAPRPDADTPAPPRFLPEYDNLLLAHADRSRVVPAEYKGRTWKGNYAYCVFLLDGFLAGVWRLEEDAKGGGAVLTIEPFGKPGRAEREELTREAERMLTRIAETSSSYDIRFGPVVDVWPRVGA
ncbi:winged helix DNA-binding domain-containing protein [Streptomyces sp. NPDC003006]